MKIFRALGSGVFRATGVWKGILTIWLFSFLLAALFVIPLRGVLKTGLGESMITERLANGIDIEVFADLGVLFSGLLSFFASGFFLVVLIGLLMNVFFTGGLFSGLRGSAGKLRLPDFFGTSAKNFWPYLVILLLVNLMLLALFLIIVVIPLSLVFQSETISEGSGFRTGIIVASIFILVLPLFILVADYARAWQASNEKPACFRALGFGFTRTFSTFFRSYLLMAVILILQVLFGVMVFSVIPVMRPASGSGVFLLFILSQLLFLIRILLKTWRYGSVTAYMEQNQDSPEEVEVTVERLADQTGPAFSPPPDPVLY